MAGGWYRFASENPSKIFTERLGHYFVWRDPAKRWDALFVADAARWRVKLLDASVEATALSPSQSSSGSTQTRDAPVDAWRGKTEERGGKARPRRNAKYNQIDAALKEISQSRPRTQEEVFQSLDGRHVPLPLAEPFASARGWMAGFNRDRSAARSWLSKIWSDLRLPPLPKGPKGAKK